MNYERTEMNEQMKYKQITDDPMGQITDKRGYAQRWGLCVRTINNLIDRGLPHLKIGARRVRIDVAEADAWMRRTYGN